MSYDRFDDPWAQDHWSCQDCGAALSQIKHGPGARWCWECRKPTEVLPPVERLLCDGCGEPAERRILTRNGALCPLCGEKFLEVQRRRAMAQGRRDTERFLDRLFGPKKAEKELVK